MRIWYDTEFIAKGQTIELVSIGMVREDGQELYAINRECDLNRLLMDPWLNQHVLPHLPVVMQDGGGWLIDKEHPQAQYMMTPQEIAADLRAMVLGAPDPQLWAWYGAYDHVVVCQMFGTMSQLPAGFPMWTNDLRQETERLGIATLPAQTGGEHHALADARWLRNAHLWVEQQSILTANNEPHADRVHPR